MNPKRLPDWLLALILTVFWRNDRVRNTLFREVECRWPKVYLSTIGQHVIVLVKSERLARLKTSLQQYFGVRCRRVQG